MYSSLFKKEKDMFSLKLVTLISGIFILSACSFEVNEKVRGSSQDLAGEKEKILALVSAQALAACGEGRVESVTFEGYTCRF